MKGGNLLSTVNHLFGILDFWDWGFLGFLGLGIPDLDSTSLLAEALM